MDAVLPLTLRDVERASLLFDSLARRFDGLGTVHVVCPEPHTSSIQAALSKWARALRFSVEPETALVPELCLAPTLDGWYRQQLIKLAIHERVATDFYLTLDADVICTREVAPEALAPGGLGLCHVIEQDLHPRWYRRTEAVLGMRGARTGVLHNVTPAVLNRHAVAELAEFLSLRSARGQLAPGIRGLKQRILSFRARRQKNRTFSPWRLFLTAGAPWTEYALYYTFLEATGRFARFHAYSPFAIYDIERSVWYADRADFGTWDPGPTFQGQGPPWFLVVQSNTHIAPTDVRQKLGRHLTHA